jgi:hypothetical protein
MPTQTLQHCQEVDMAPQPMGPFQLTAGGPPGIGHVDVVIRKPHGDEGGSVPCGDTQPFDASGATEVKLHYQKGDGGPDMIEVSW